MEENQTNKFTHYVGIKFHYSNHAYFFGFKDLDKSIKINRVVHGIIAQFFTIKCGQCNY